MKIFFGLWLLGSVLFTGILHFWHGVDFRPSAKERSKFVSEASGQWEMIHIIGAGCLCSEYLASYLEKRGLASSKKANEKIYILGDMPEQENILKQKGFSVHSVNPKSLDIPMGGVPLLLIYDQEGKLQYVGGYSDRLIGPQTEIQDLAILSNLIDKQAIAELPARGCAVSKTYANILDPLGFKYAKEDMYE